MSELQGRLISYVYSSEGRQADIALVEPNGDEHVLRCLVKPTGTDLGGDHETLAYLNHRYGPETVCRTAKQTVVG